MSGLSDLVDSFVGGISGLFGTGYNIWANKRDFDYQKSLQQEIFNREDTAVQRRMEDLKKAGLNPNLATGSAAAAGSVVSRSNTNDVNFGATLDAIAAIKQIKGQTIANEIANYEKDSAKSKATADYWTSEATKHEMATKMGLTTMPHLGHDGKVRQPFRDPNPYDDEEFGNPYKSPVVEQYDAAVKEFQWTDQKHSNELTALIQKGQEILTNKQKIQLESQKLTWEMEYESAKFKQDAIFKQVDAICEMLGVQQKAEMVKLELKKFDWSKEKWSYEQLCNVIVGLTDSLSF